MVSGIVSVVDRPLAWHHDDPDRAISGNEAVSIVQASIEAGVTDVVFQHRAGGCLTMITNGERAMLVRWWRPGEDEGVAAFDTSAGSTRRSGYVLSNGQVDTYRDDETVPLDAATSAVRHIVDTDELDPKLDWRAW